MVTPHRQAGFWLAKRLAGRPENLQGVPLRFKILTPFSRFQALSQGSFDISQAVIPHINDSLTSYMYTNEILIAVTFNSKDQPRTCMDIWVSITKEFVTHKTIHSEIFENTIS